MKINSFQLPSSTRLTISKLVIIVMLLTLFSPTQPGYSRSRGDVLPRELSDHGVVETVVSQGAIIEVNRSGDGDNINPAAGCDTDAASPGEQCTLRAAIQRANALAGDDEIRFNIPMTEPNCDSSVDRCTINLTQPLPPLGTNVRIVGPGADKLTVRRSTGGDYRIFTVTSASDLTFSGLKIVGGRPFGISSGGAIANAGSAIGESYRQHTQRQRRRGRWWLSRRYLQ